MTSWITLAVSTVLAALAGWVVPAWAMKHAVPTLESSRTTLANYRGKNVTLGLGIVWLVWAVGIEVVNLAVGVLAISSPEAQGGSAPAWFGVFAPFSAAVKFVPLLLVIGVFALGLVDDCFGSSASRGFRGHLRELLSGRLTTGMLKMLGIGVLALASAGVAGSNYVESLSAAGAPSFLAHVLGFLGAWVCGALFIALTANFVNLMDLRPGRALKTYVLLAVLALASVGWSLSAMGAGGGVVGQDLPVVVATFVCLTLIILGPVFAVWRYDLGERAMLGDAGANVMGAFAGYLVASSAPLWVLAAATVIMIALNIASERVSFSRVIEARGFLRWIDRLGRLREEPGDGDVRAGGGTAEDGTDDPSSGETGTDDGRDGGS